MAYMSQETKKQIAPVVKAICKKYGIKATMAVRHHSTLVLNIKSGNIDFIGNYNETVNPLRGDRKAEHYLDVNPYWYHDHFSGKAKECLKEIFAAMNNGNWDKSDIQTDYFNVGWYVDVNVGSWNKPYELTA